MNHLQHGRITLKGVQAQALIKPKPQINWQEIDTIKQMETQTEATITERVIPVRKHWRPYLKNDWGLRYWDFKVVLNMYKQGTPMKEVQLIARILLDSERKGHEVYLRRQKSQQGRLSECEFRRQLNANAWAYGLAYTDSEMIGVLT